MAINSASMILRVIEYAPLFTKGTELDWEDVDNNFIKIYQDLSAKVQAGSVPAFSPVRVYKMSDATNYNEKTWLYVNEDPSSGTEPGSDPDYWQDVDPSIFTHKQNTDTALAEGTDDEVTAADLKSWMSTPVKTLYADDSEFTDNRTADLMQFMLSFVNGKQFVFESTADPGAGEASFDFKGFGTFGGSETIAKFRSYAGESQLSVLNYGVEVRRNMGINGAPASGFYGANVYGDINTDANVALQGYLSLTSGFASIRNTSNQIDFRGYSGHVFKEHNGVYTQLEITNDAGANNSGSLDVKGQYGTIYFSKSAPTEARIGAAYDGEYFLYAKGKTGVRMASADGAATLSLLPDEIYQRSYKSRISESYNTFDDLFKVELDIPSGIVYTRLKHMGTINNVLQMGARNDASMSGGTPAAHTFNQFAKEAAVNNMAPHWLTENGDEVRLYKQNLPLVPTLSDVITILTNLGLC